MGKNFHVCSLFILCIFVKCMSSCEGRDDLSKCQFDCEMTLGRDSQEFVHLLQCMSANDCFPEVLLILIFSRDSDLTTSVVRP